MGVFGAFFGRRGVIGFNGPVLGASSGVVGFNVAMFVRPVREVFRPARPGVGASAKKFALQAQNGRKTQLFGVLGEYFRGDASGGAVPGELCRAEGLAAGHFYWHPRLCAAKPTYRVNARKAVSAHCACDQ